MTDRVRIKHEAVPGCGSFLAIDEHVALLKKSVAAWNAWRDENRKICLNLSGACLMQANLIGANLSAANLHGAKLKSCTLSN